MGIQGKEAKCKGTGKAIGHGCGNPTAIRKYGLGFSCGCYQKWLFGTKEGGEVIKKCSLSASRKVKKEKAKESREYKQRNKSIARLIQDARTPFHAFIRFRDANLPCISCDSTDAMIWDAGHFYKAELYTGLIFDENNVHKQCRKCNTFLDGNENEYRKGLIKRFGIDYVLELDEKAIKLRTKKFERDELESIKKEYQIK
jgi:hypothetical protein